MRKHSRSTARRDPEAGYVLLLVFAMAAIVAVTLYMQVPRVAFEAQRDKEELLMDRGHEYIRAITLFVHKFNRFPASMDELENTNRLRFLRRRYVDPMTGKADWRLLHAGPGGAITDSVTAKKTDAATTQQNFITELKMFGADTDAGSEGVNIAARRRASDQAGAPGEAAGSGNGPVDNNVLNNSGNPPNPQAGNTGYNGPVMVLPNGTIVPATTTGVPGAGGPSGNSPVPGAPGFGFGAPGAFGSSGGAPLPSGVAIQQNALNGQQNVPALPGQLQPPNGAAGLINQILTTPRPGGINGMPGAPGMPGTGGTFVAAPNSQGTSLTTAPVAAPTAAPAGQQVIGAGIAGVASKREQEGIKTYNDRTKYNEWEFVYDISKDPTKNPNANMAGAAGASGGQSKSGSGSSTPPSSSPFGQSSTGQSPATPPPSTTGTTPSQ
jgi:hypothetical protein